MARPKIEIDESQVEAMAAIGCTVEEIALVLGCSERTLQSRFCTPMKKGRARMNRSLRRKQIDMALSGNVTMLIWLGKQMLGQREKDPKETEDKSGPLVDFLLNQINKMNGDKQ